MPKVRNKKLKKLREYRDKLLFKISNLEGFLRERDAKLAQIRKALQQENALRAYALAAPYEHEDSEWAEVAKLNDLVTELTAVYRLLAMERDYTLEIDKALKTNDMLRARALVEQHQADQIHHDKMLQKWGVHSGFMRHLKGQLKETNP